MTLTFKHDADCVSNNQHAKYLGKGRLVRKLLPGHTDTHTHTHTHTEKRFSTWATEGQVAGAGHNKQASKQQAIQ